MFDAKSCEDKLFALGGQLKGWTRWRALPGDRVLTSGEAVSSHTAACVQRKGRAAAVDGKDEAEPPC